MFERPAFRNLLTPLSLALNLFLIGWVVTQYFAEPNVTRPDPSSEIVAEIVARALPKADGDLLRQAIDQKRPMLQEARQNYLVTLDHFRQAILAEPLDENALRTTLVEMRVARQAERTLFGDTIVDILPRMSPPGRQAFVTSHLGGRR